MNEQTIETLELPKILERLASHTSFSASRELALALQPTGDRFDVARRQQLTTEARRLFDLRPNVTIGGARDVRTSLQRATLAGQLDPEELLEIAATLAAGRTLRSTIIRLIDDVPALADLSQLIVDRPVIEAEIARCISDRGEVADSASPELARLRAEIKVTHSRLIERLNDIISSSTYKPILQESIVTIREGRYVVPVRSEARSQMPGIVHDQSSSGATVFVEPLLTVEMNNRWRQLQIEEQYEVQRILRELTAMVATSADDIAGNVAAIAQIDLAFAKARYASLIRAVEPALADPTSRRAEERELRLIQARHPLLSGTVVPIDVRLGGDFTVLLITGPNTGGKTVALKTVGLLTLMAQSGLHIPAADGSRVPVFATIHADIGDEQSIEQSLSTFSSHMKRIINLLPEAGASSLVLLDEVGAGTDPTEGSALARAILSHLLERGAWVVATTHYAELKAYAQNTEGVQNASVEFDVETLSPTYRLSIGLPGRSNALAIASRLGLPTDLIESAREMVSPEDQQIETLLAGIQEERERAAFDRDAAERERRRAEQIRQELTAQRRELDAERQSILAGAREDARDELADVRDKLRHATSLIDRATAGRQDLYQAAQELRETERDLAAKAARRSKPIPGAGPGLADDGAKPLRVGDTVLVRSLGQRGEVASLSDDGAFAEVSAGGFKLRVSTDDLDRAKGGAPASGQTPARYSTIMVGERSAPIQIDLRGWRAEQVGPELERYLDDAALTGLPFVRIVHGKGTGVLRQVVRDILSGHSLVASYAAAEARDGGEGVTIVKLRS